MAGRWTGAFLVAAVIAVVGAELLRAGEPPRSYNSTQTTRLRVRLVPAKGNIWQRLVDGP